MNHTIFSALPAGDLSADSLLLGKAALDSNDYLIFDAGKLYYDPDGSGAGAATLLAQLAGVTALTVNDFMIV